MQLQLCKCFTHPMEEKSAASLHLEQQRMIKQSNQSIADPEMIEQHYIAYALKIPRKLTDPCRPLDEGTFASID